MLLKDIKAAYPIFIYSKIFYVFLEFYFELNFTTFLLFQDHSMTLKSKFVNNILLVKLKNVFFFKNE